jgi:hypothetical protein
MTEHEWVTSDDPIAMLEALQCHRRDDEEALLRLIQRYLLACCRRIWKLLPMEGSRRGVEVAERYLDGHATKEEFGIAEWNAEGAAFFIDHYENDFSFLKHDLAAREDDLRYAAEVKTRVEQMIREIEAIPVEELQSLVRPVPSDAPLSAFHLLESAAYFVDTAMNYPGIKPREGLLEQAPHFLYAPLLREIIRNPFGPGKPWETS